MSPSLGSPKPSGRTAPRRTPTRCRSSTSRPRTARAVSKYYVEWVSRRYTRLLAFNLGAGGDPNIRYYHSYWRLPAGMALRIRVRPPPCRCWNFQLNNHWMESLDYRYAARCSPPADALRGGRV